ncbi:MAG: hypothetical protein OHK0012_24540 [Synechococcales cyanobacterium]
MNFDIWNFLKISINYGLPILFILALIVVWNLINWYPGKFWMFNFYSVLRKDAPSDKDLDTLFPHLPPHPGWKGRWTLEGIDSNGNGVRDDIERYIYRLSPDSEVLRKALMQFAKATQERMLNTHNRSISIELTTKMLRAQSCITAVHWKYDLKNTGGSFIDMDLYWKINNTQARVDASWKADQNFSGQVYSMPHNLEDACDFEV